jgi:hypothetical protein
MGNSPCSKAADRSNSAPISSAEKGAEEERAFGQHEQMLKGRLFHAAICCSCRKSAMHSYRETHERREEGEVEKQKLLRLKEFLCVLCGKKAFRVEAVRCQRSGALLSWRPVPEGGKAASSR